MDGDDDDLQRALELSLQQFQTEQQRRQAPVTIDLDSDSDAEDDEDVAFNAQMTKALALSQAEAGEKTRSAAPAARGALKEHPPLASSSRDAIATAPESSTTSSGSGSTSAFLSQRAQLEQERLERQKRLRPQQQQRQATPPSRSSSTTESGSDDEIEERPAKRQHVSTQARAGPSSSTHPAVHQKFWNGELRQTATQHAEPRKDGQPTFRLTEVLGPKSDIAFAILSSYSLDWSWIYSFFDASVPVIMVAQPDESGDATVKNVLPNWVRTTTFLRNGRGCQHMKFMLLFYKDAKRLRVVVSTANLVAYDWRDMENSVWLQDIPLRTKEIPHDHRAVDFPAMLQKVLHAVNVKPALEAVLKDNHPDLPIKAVEELRQKWDWSNVKVHLVSSIAGKHEGWPKVIQTGHTRLMSVVRRMSLNTGNGKRSKDVVVECQGSSLGLYSSSWLNEFHYSARGKTAEDWLDKPKRTRDKAPIPSIKIIFPTRETVRASALGEKGGGTIFCRKRQWNSANFPRQIFYDSKSKAGPVLMHSKMMIAMLQDNVFAKSSNKNKHGKRRQDYSDSEDAPDDEDSDDDIQIIEPAAGWAYVGSHNFTPSAWGTLSGSAFNPTLNITNYELGIVFPLKDAEEAKRVACFERPAKKYGPRDVAWIQEDSDAFRPEGVEVEEVS